MPAPPLSPIGRNVLRLRSKRRWSRESLAEHARVTVQTIYNIETGRVFWPQFLTMRGLAHALGVSISELRAPTNEEADNWQSQITALEQQELGARWAEDEGRFAIDSAGEDSDISAARETLVQQLHPSIVDKAKRFSETSKRLDNALGWNGITAAANRFKEGVQRPTEDIVGQLGSIYSAILELGSFLEQDTRLRQSTDSDIDPLDPEIYRELSDLIRTGAPWLRQFPTIRELDEQSTSFLTNRDLLEPGAALITSAREKQLVSADDAAALLGLMDAAKRGELQGIKATTRSVLGVRNLLYAAATIVASFLSGAIASSYAEQSLLMKHAGAFLAQEEVAIVQFLSDLPTDLHTAFQELLKELHSANN